MRIKLLGGVAAAAVGALAVPMATSAQQPNCPPGVTNPEYCIGGSGQPPEEWTERAVEAIANAFGIERSAVRVVRFNGAILVLPPNGNADRSELLSDDGLVVGMMLCTRSPGCETGTNVKNELGERLFYNKKTAERLDEGEYRTLRTKVAQKQAALLGRATVIRVATTTRLRAPENKAILGKAKRQMRLELG